MKFNIFFMIKPYKNRIKGNFLNMKRGMMNNTISYAML